MVKKIWSNIQIVLTWVIAIGVFVIIAAPYFLLKKQGSGKTGLDISSDDIKIKDVETNIDKREDRTIEDRKKSINMAKSWLDKLNSLNKEV